MFKKLYLLGIIPLADIICPTLFLDFSLAVWHWGIPCLLQRQQEVKIMERMEQLVVIHNQGQRMLANLHRYRHTFKM